MNFRICGLPLEPFRELFALDDASLRARGARRVIADDHYGFPCRVTLKDAAPGESLILLNFAHLDEQTTPYRASGPIYVRETASQRFEAINEVPAQQRQRQLSVRAYSASHLMRAADVIDGRQLEALIEKFFRDPQISYLHVHNALPGCYACRVDRA